MRTDLTHEQHVDSLKGLGMTRVQGEREVAAARGEYIGDVVPGPLVPYPAATHLAATRGRGLYDHHGISMGDGSVFELEKEKPAKRAKLRVVSFDAFAGGGDVRVVEHGRARLADVYKPLPSDPTDVVLDRIARLLRIGDLGPYHLWGLNCEHVANFCMTGIADSTQVRQRWFGSNALIGGALLLWLSWSVGRGRAISKPMLGLIVLFMVVRLAPGIRGQLATRRFTALIAREQPPGSLSQRPDAE